MTDVISLMPNGMQQFADANGVPYLAGKVYMEVPNTNTPKVNWVDMDHLAENTYPIVLDAAGRCVIWGEGIYRQRLLDLDGNEIWDKLTSSDTADTATPGPPDKSVQFNDAGDFGGSAFFLFEKTTGRATLGQNAALNAAITWNLADIKSVAGALASFKVISTALSLTVAGVVTDAYGIYVNQPVDAGAGSFTNVYGIYVADHSSVPTNIGYNIYSDGATSANAFLGESAFGTIPVYNAERATVRIATTAGNFNLYSDGTNSRNLLEGHLEVLNHSAFGSVDAYLTTSVANFADAWTGAMSVGSSITTGSTYAPTSGDPTIQDISVGPVVTSGNVTNLIGVFSSPTLNTSGTAAAIFGGSFTASWQQGTVTSRIVGVDAIANGGSSPTYIAGMQTTYGGATATNGYGLYVLGCSGATTNYGIYVTEMVVAGYNIWSDHTGGSVGNGKNFFGAGMQIGATDTNLSRTAAGELAVGTGAEGSAAGTMRAASYTVGATPGGSGSFTTVDAKTVTVVNGIVTTIV